MLETIKKYLILITICCIGTVDAQTWAPPHQFSIQQGNDVHVGADANGNAIAVWHEILTTPEGDVIRASYFTNGIWGPAETISIPSFAPAPQHYSDEPEVAMDASGTALAIWEDFDRGVIYTATFNSSTWSTPTPLDGPNLFSASPQIAMDGTGKGIASWTNDFAVRELRVALYNGTSWTPFTNIAINAELSSIDISSNGTAMVVWRDFVTGDIMASHFDGATWGAPTPISTAGSNSAPDVGIDANGNGVAVWSDGTDILAAYFNGGTATWSLPILISSGIINTSPRVDMQTNGKAVAVWVDGAGAIQAAILNGATWTAAELISTNGPNENPEVAMDEGGNAVAVWSFNSGEILVSAFLIADLGDTWQPPIFVEQDTLAAFFPDTAFSQSGRAFAVWNDSDGLGDTFGSFIDIIIPPPTNFTVVSCKDHFAWQTDCVNTLSFTPVTDPIVVSYRLKRNDVIIANIPASGPFTFVDHNRCKADVYSLVSVTASGDESLPVFVTTSFKR